MKNLFDGLKIVASEDEEEYEPEFDFSAPEDVIIHVYEAPGSGHYEWEGWGVEILGIDSTHNKTGAASYEEGYGGFLDYVIEGMVDCPKKVGVYVVEGITATFVKGDGWMTDDDMEYDFRRIRPATQKEIDMWF